MRQMLRGYIQGYVELAAGLAEAAGKRVVGTAGDLLERVGVDIEAAERTVAGQLPPLVHRLETLAQEVVTVGRGGVDLAVGLARAEAEKAVERAGKLGDQVVKVGVVLAYLEGKLRDLEGGGAAGTGTGTGAGTAAERPAKEQEKQEKSGGRTSGVGRAEGLFADDWEPEQGWGTEPPGGAGFAPLPPDEEQAEAEPPGELMEGAEHRGTGERGGVKRAPVKKASAAKKAAVKRAPSKRVASEKEAPVRKAAVKKAPVKRVAAAKTAVEEAPVKKAAAKRAPAKTASATKTAATEPTAKKAAAKRSGAQQPAAKRTAARKPAAAKKAQAGEGDV
ncbi:histone H1-like repetitive region-containing protein [Kitasatospora sp. LaBMicrA B282]|uniref:histone H1-like repetitive region-containing protein n=1 Tax=Kitasatospora sp. LaBMicrA B282 TaxID=3420949 RepID=UPI003D117C5E